MWVELFHSIEDPWRCGGISSILYPLQTLGEDLYEKQQAIRGEERDIIYLVGAGLSFIAVTIWNTVNLLRLLKIF
jgi:hypothetical protein